MPRLSFRRIIRRPITLLPLLINLAVLLPQPVRAEVYLTTGPNDFFFTLEEPQTFTVRTYAAQYGIDSMLWLYNSSGQLLTANDDYFGLDSYISMTLQPDTYRLRTGICCGNPNAWQGTSYQIDTNLEMIGGVAVTTTTTTTLAPYFNAPTNLQASQSGNQVTLSWDAGEVSNTEPYMWNITWYDMDSGQQSGGWGIWTYANNRSAVITLDNTTSGYGDTRFTISAGTAACVGEGPGNCLYGPTSAVDVNVPVPTTTTTSTTTTVAPPTTETTVPDTTVPEPTPFTENPQSSTAPEPVPTTSELPPTSVTPPSVPETIVPTTLPVVETTTTQVPRTIPPTQTTTSSTPTSTTTSVPAPEDEQVSPTTVPPTTVPFTVPEVVVELPSADVLLELPPEQLQEVFESIDMDALTPEQQEQLIEQLTTAPDEVKKEFEETINVFDGGFDTYVPTGSTIDVGTRRVIVAVTSVLSVLPIPSSAPPSAPTSGPAGGAPSDGGGTTSEEKPRRSRRGRN